MMASLLPLCASPIHVTWRLAEGGIGVTASTDVLGLPYIGLYHLTGQGQPSEHALRFQRQRLMANIVVGTKNRVPLVVFIDAEITLRGLSLRVTVPHTVNLREYTRQVSAQWDSAPPSYGAEKFAQDAVWFSDRGLS
jgi:hypothetical protein